MSVPFVPTAFTTPVLSPNSLTYTRSAPYISPSQYRALPTAMATGQLIPGDSSNIDSTNVLANIIQQASQFIDDYCFHGADGTFAAAASVESDWVKVKDNGMVYLICNFKPVIAVLGIALGPAPGQLSSLTNATTVAIRGKTIEIPPSWNGSGQGFNFPVPTWRGGVYAVWQYVNGWSHMSLTTNAPAGASSITVANTILAQTVFGLYPGTQLSIQDGARSESAVVANSYVPGSLVIPLVSPLVFTHTVPASTTSDWIPVSALPDSITRAAALLTSAFIKTRGTRAQVLPTTPGNKANSQALAQAGAFEDVEWACKMLTPFRIAYLHA